MSLDFGYLQWVPRGPVVFNFSLGEDLSLLNLSLRQISAAFRSEKWIFWSLRSLFVTTQDLKPHYGPAEMRKK